MARKSKKTQKNKSREWCNGCQKLEISQFPNGDNWYKCDGELLSYFHDQLHRQGDLITKRADCPLD